MVLAIFLVTHTHSAEIAGPVSGPPPYLTPGTHAAYSPAPRGTSPVWIVQQGETSDAEETRRGMAGISCSGSGQSDGNGPMTMYWGFQLPDEAAKAAQVGDEMVIRAKSFYPPGVRGFCVSHLRYEFRRGEETRSFSESANGKFILVSGLFVSAPLVLWGVAAGVVALSGLLKKASKLE